MKTISVFWQSQTGNTYAIAGKSAEVFIKSGFDVKIHHIVSDEKPDFNSDLFIFAFPIFNFKPATTMRDFIKNIPYQKEKKKALGIMTYTGMPANAAHVLKGYLSKQNIELIDCFGTRCDETYIPLKKWIKKMLKYGKPDGKSFDEAEKFVKDTIASDFKRKKTGFNPFQLFHWMAVVSPDNATGKFLGNRLLNREKCTLCGNCYLLCPSGAIERKDKEIAYKKELCLGCCGCLNVCPTHAWSDSKFGTEFCFKGLYTNDLLSEVKSKIKKGGI